MSERRFIRATLHGDVQGVGFRAFVERQAVEHGVEGWVRNRADGSVEALLSGADAAVAAVLDACRTGPAGARVERVEVREEDAAGLIPSSRPSGFYILPTV